MLMGKGEEKETGEATRDNVCRMIEEGNLMSEICEELKISSASYWEIKKEWAERKRRESTERREFYRLRVTVHERCKRLLMRLTKEVARYCEKGTVEEIERIREGLPLVRNKEELQKEMEVLQKKGKEIEDATLKAGVERREKEIRIFHEELEKAEERRLRDLDESAAQYNRKLSEDQIIMICKLLVEKNGIGAIERIMEIHRDTISDVVEDLARHAREVADFLIRNVGLTKVQVDEMWSFVKEIKES